MGAPGAASTYDHILEKTRLPQPSFQRLAVSTLFQKLRSASPSTDLDSEPARDALSRCLASSSAPVADQAVRELCRLVQDGHFPVSAALLELHSALEGCAPGFVPLFVKGIGFLVRYAWGADPSCGVRFEPVELHPFVKVLSCRTEVQDELIRQIFLFILQNKSQGLETASLLLQPFLLFAILQAPSSSFSSSFTQNLICSVASLSCAIPSESIGILKLLAGCLTYFPHTNDEELKCLLLSAEFVVNAFVIVLKQMSCVEMMSDDAKTCCMDVIENLLSLCIAHNKPWVRTETILELSKHLLVAQRELGLPYLPEHAMVTVLVSVILTQAEFEHDHLSALKLLVFLEDWKSNNENINKGSTCYHYQELLWMFPVINLVSSSSRSVKMSACRLLSRARRLVLELSFHPERLQIPLETSSVKIGSILLRFLHHIWFQEQYLSPYSFFIGYASNCIEHEQSTMHWTSQLKEYLSTVARNKTNSITQSPEVPGGGSTPLLISVASILLLHPKLSTLAIECLSAVGATNPKLCMPLLITVLFHNNILCREGCHSPKIMLQLLQLLPSLASQSIMVPLILQTLSPMLHKNSKPILYATALRLLCKTWIANDLAFCTLQGHLDPKAYSHFISQREICISIAASVRDVCVHNPDRGVDLILSISSSIDSRDSIVHALGLESLAYLCEADVIDFYTAWDVISDRMLDYSADPIVAHRLCFLLRWGAMDAEVYSEASRNIIKILWEIGTSMRQKYESSWVKAQAAAFESLSHFEVMNVQESIPEFKRRTFECLVSGYNVEVLNAMEKLVVKILKFEHINRRRGIKQKRVAVNKVEKLLDVFPHSILPPGKQELGKFPGAALLNLDFTPKDLNSQATKKDLPKVHAAYERALLEIVETLHVSRNIFLALLAVQSLKPFMNLWLRAVIVLADAKSFPPFCKNSKDEYDILKTLCRVGSESIPRISSNIAFAIAALCMVLPSSAHMVVSSAAGFLFKWLFEYEHEHRQWSSAISLGLLCTCFDAADKKQRFEVVNGLLKVLHNTKSHLVKGACGVGLGFACHNLLSRRKVGSDFDLEGQFTEITETSLVEHILNTLLMMICELCPFAADSLKNLSSIFPFSGQSMNSNLSVGDCYNFEEDAWGTAGLVLGLGYSVVALYHLGSYDAVLKIKDLLISWVSFDFAQNDFSLRNELSNIPLCMGSCLALPIVAAFCQRHEIVNIDFDILYSHYYSLITELFCLKKSGTVYQNLLMSSCIGAGSFVSCMMNIGVHLIKLDDLKHLMEALRTIYSSSYPPLVCFGGMLGVVNAFGAGAGEIFQMYPLATISQPNSEQEAMFISGPVLSSPSCEKITTSIIQEMFLLAKESNDQQIKSYAAWALSLLRYQWWSSESQNFVSSENKLITHNSLAQTFDEKSLVWIICMWLRDVNRNKNISSNISDGSLQLLSYDVSATKTFYANEFTILVKAGEVVDANNVASILRCLSEAPRLPDLDWGAIIRRCMRYDLQSSSVLQKRLAFTSLRRECLNFSLVHARHAGNLLLLMDELSDLSRFTTLELNLQMFLLEHLSELCKIFSGERLEKLFADFIKYFSSSSYLAYEPDKKSLLRVSFWKGLCQCLVEPSKEVFVISNAEKCMACLFPMLPIFLHGGFSEEYTGEWSVAIRCLSEARKEWLEDMLQIPVFYQSSEEHVVAKIITKARLVGTGCYPISELAKLKSWILNGKTADAWWSMLVEVSAALMVADDRIKRQWLLDALEISCVSEYPSTALRFVGLLSSSCCMYMPLLIIDPTSVLSDLPVTLPSLLSESNWSTSAGVLVEKLWVSTERICTWAKHLATIGDGAPSRDQIDASETTLSVFFACVMRDTCLSLKEFLPFDKQLKLSNIEVV